MGEVTLSRVQKLIRNDIGKVLNEVSLADLFRDRKKLSHRILSEIPRWAMLVFACLIVMLFFGNSDTTRLLIGAGFVGYLIEAIRHGFFYAQKARKIKHMQLLFCFGPHETLIFEYSPAKRDAVVKALTVLQFAFVAERHSGRIIEKFPDAPWRLPNIILGMEEMPLWTHCQAVSEHTIRIKNTIVSNKWRELKISSVCSVIIGFIGRVYGSDKSDDYIAESTIAVKRWFYDPTCSELAARNVRLILDMAHAYPVDATLADRPWCCTDAHGNLLMQDDDLDVVVQFVRELDVAEQKKVIVLRRSFAEIKNSLRAEQHLVN